MSQYELGREILRLVASHNGEWYWYQIDRALTGKYADPPTQLMDCIRGLEKSGLIEIRPNSALGAIPRYWVTNAGRLAAARS